MASGGPPPPKYSTIMSVTVALDLHGVLGRFHELLIHVDRAISALVMSLSIKVGAAKTFKRQP